MPEYSQEGRIIAVNTPLGEDALLLQRLAGVEGISRLYTFHLDLLSENPSISFTDIVGKGAAIRIRLAGGETRYVNGFVSRFMQTGRDQRFTHIGFGSADRVGGWMLITGHIVYRQR